MSADNGNYFCSFPKGGEYEVYIVWNGSDSVLNDLQDPTICGGELYKEIFEGFFYSADGPYTEEEAMVIRNNTPQSDDPWDLTEYGNCGVKFNHPFDQPYQEKQEYVFPDYACLRCSTRYSTVSHAVCDKDPSLPKNLFKDALKEKWGITNTRSPLNFEAIVNNVWCVLEDLDLLKES